MVEPAIVSALSSLFGGRIFSGYVPPGTAHPFCIYQHVGGRPSNTFCGDTDKQNTRIQFHVWCAREPSGGGSTQAMTLMRQVAGILTAAPLYGVSQGGPIDVPDDATKTHGVHQDFSFWA